MDGGLGCKPAAFYPVCQVSSGATETCTDLCTASEYYLDCIGPFPGLDSGALPAQPPEPDPSLNCTPQFPNPINDQAYCCACAP